MDSPPKNSVLIFTLDLGGQTYACRAEMSGNPTLDQEMIETSLTRLLNYRTWPIA